jgi:hypothetical protein
VDALQQKELLNCLMSFQRAWGMLHRTFTDQALFGGAHIEAFKDTAHRFATLHRRGDLAVGPGAFDCVAYFMPAVKHEGVFTTSLITGLCVVQSSLIAAAQKHTKRLGLVTERPHTLSFKNMHLVRQNAIRFDDQALIPILMLHSNRSTHSLQYGHGADVGFDLEAIQEALVPACCGGKMRFDLNTLSMFTALKSVSHQQLLIDVERNVPQTALPRTASESFIRKLNAEQKQHAALHALRSAITFLSLCGAARYDPTMPLKKYMSKYLFIETEE